MKNKNNDHDETPKRELPPYPEAAQRENCAERHADERIQLTLRDGTPLTAKWTCLKSSDVAAEVLEPESLKGKPISGLHTPWFVMHLGHWYYKDGAVTQEGYDAIRKSAQHLNDLVVFCRQNREQVKAVIEELREAVFADAGEYDDAIIAMRLCRWIKAQQISERGPSIYDAANIMNWLKEDRL